MFYNSLVRFLQSLELIASDRLSFYLNVSRMYLQKIRKIEALLAVAICDPKFQVKTKFATANDPVFRMV